MDTEGTSAGSKAEPATGSHPDWRRDSEASTGEESTADSSQKQEIDHILIDCERLSVYHSMRRDFMDRWQRVSLFLVVLSGTAVFADFGEKISLEFMGIFPVLFGLASLVFDFTGKSRIHEIQYRRFCDLHGDILSDLEIASNAHKWQDRIHQIHIDDPPTYRALDTLAQNMTYMGRGMYDNLWKIPRLHLFFKNVFPFWSAKYEEEKS
uniref:SMODS and SLOG-associating 2TM effector domain-containing protein n=1 Tax=Candidatus Kentrum sp. LFY TaxID=2126342 RepID=A0A450UJV6_9GAMM|nr:MAG: hypothetical protein BECKLFY1418A_GA0070994_102633 [Candidatus Kentron sp. LFY]